MLIWSWLDQPTSYNNDRTLFVIHVVFLTHEKKVLLNCITILIQMPNINGKCLRKNRMFSYSVCYVKNNANLTKKYLIIGNH